MSVFVAVAASLDKDAFGPPFQSICKGEVAIKLGLPHRVFVVEVALE